MGYRSKLFFIVFIGAISVSFTPLYAASDPVVEAKVALLERQVKALQAKLGGAPLPQSVGSAGSAGTDSRMLIADLVAKVGSLESEMRTLTGKLEEYDYRLRQQDDAIDLLRKELALQQQDMATMAAAGPQARPRQVPAAAATSETAAVKPAALEKAKEADGVVLPEASAAEQYKYAFSFVQKNDLNNGRIALEKFIATTDDKSLAGNAQYWLGRIYLQEGKNGLAAQQLFSLVEDYPNHPKRADALVDLASALVKLGSSEDACNAIAEYRRVDKGASSRLVVRADRVSEEAKCK